ncbi:hypothetical protein ACHAXA_000517 [Cyclostephanos tholiformis]|uniref:Uncharacterized protein n=1 Tax=Cyclostephanos tholiformis TaxID=382380 RepID=A0ABD3SSP3_9STRA
MPAPPSEEEEWEGGGGGGGISMYAIVEDDAADDDGTALMGGKSSSPPYTRHHRSVDDDMTMADDDCAYGSHGTDEWDDAACGTMPYGMGGEMMILGSLSSSSSPLIVPPPPRGGRGDAMRRIGGGIFERSVAVARDGDGCGRTVASALMTSLREGYARRKMADPNFRHKSILEVILAITSQCVAEYRIRGGLDGMLNEVDFVFAGVLTAVCGKYYSMWKVARTIIGGGIEERANDDDDDGITAEDFSPAAREDGVPTNAFQRTSPDGRAVPSIKSRLSAFVLPMPSLFGAGALSSTFGYGLTSILIRVRSCIAPNHAVATRPVPVFLAVLYTGVYVAVFSNLRYQILQGIVEPYLIDGSFSTIERALSCDDDVGRDPGAQPGRRKMSIWLRSLLRTSRRASIVLVRYANGVLGSWISIRGMKILGLQRMK